MTKMRNVLILFLALVLGGCATNQKSVAVRVKGHEHLHSLSKVLGENIDKSHTGYHKRLEALWKKLNNIEFTKKLRTLADDQGRADVTEVLQLVVKWNEVKDKIRDDLAALRRSAATVKKDLAKMQVIINSLADLAQLESQKTSLDATDVARILATVSEAAKELNLEQPVPEPEDAEFDDIVNRLSGGGD